ncbi:hypothetical protein ACR77J_07480 [Tissierella praeacuta]|uniref:hypothetical protein n=1 Tax=Tissierella praeacuta TaxID=43131 RepID=UPI003DA631CF
MRSNIFIPKQINVGFQNRNDTYTKKLAYVTYFDEKGKLRKEKSWNGWRDKSIDNVIHDNIPTEGFVLNKKVGDYCDWNHRQAYVRVYDPRDFEFEITIENLLYILQNANSIKGKGLEGEFIYGWDGTELVLIPLESPDYKEIMEFNKIVHENKTIKAKDLIIGATYRTKQNEDYIYMGRFDKWTTDYSKDIHGDRNVNKGKHHYFARKVKYSWCDEEYLGLIITKSLGNRFISVISSDCVENYAELFNMLEVNTSYSPLDKSKDEYIQYTFDEVVEKINDNRWKEFVCYGVGRNEYKISTYDNESDVYTYSIREHRNYGWDYKKRDNGSLEEIYNIIKPMYKNEYLQNGKLYREGK